MGLNGAPLNSTTVNAGGAGTFVVHHAYAACVITSGAAAQARLVGGMRAAVVAKATMVVAAVRRAGARAVSKGTASIVANGTRITYAAVAVKTSGALRAYVSQVHAAQATAVSKATLSAAAKTVRTASAAVVVTTTVTVSGTRLYGAAACVVTTTVAVDLDYLNRVVKSGAAVKAGALAIGNAVQTHQASAQVIAHANTACDVRAIEVDAGSAESHTRYTSIRIVAGSGLTITVQPTVWSSAGAAVVIQRTRITANPVRIVHVAIHIPVVAVVTALATRVHNATASAVATGVMLAAKAVRSAQATAVANATATLLAYPRVIRAGEAAFRATSSMVVGALSVLIAASAVAQVNSSASVESYFIRAGEAHVVAGAVTIQARPQVRQTTWAHAACVVRVSTSVKAVNTQYASAAIKARARFLYSERVTREVAGGTMFVLFSSRVMTPEFTNRLMEVTG